MDTVSLRRNADGAGELEGVGYRDAPGLSVGRAVPLGVGAREGVRVGVWGTRGGETFTVPRLPVGDGLDMPVGLLLAVPLPVGGTLGVAAGEEDTYGYVVESVSSGGKKNPAQWACVAHVGLGR